MHKLYDPNWISVILYLPSICKEPVVFLFIYFLRVFLQSKMHPCQSIEHIDQNRTANGNRITSCFKWVPLQAIALCISIISTEVQRLSERVILLHWGQIFHIQYSIEQVFICLLMEQCRIKKFRLDMEIYMFLLMWTI